MIDADEISIDDLPHNANWLSEKPDLAQIVHGATTKIKLSVVQEQTAREKLIFALLHPSHGAEHQRSLIKTLYGGPHGVGDPIGHAVGTHHEPEHGIPHLGTPERAALEKAAGEKASAGEAPSYAESKAFFANPKNKAVYELNPQTQPEEIAASFEHLHGDATGLFQAIADTRIGMEPVHAAHQVALDEENTRLDQLREVARAGDPIELPELLSQAYETDIASLRDSGIENALYGELRAIQPLEHNDEGANEIFIGLAPIDGTAAVPVIVKPVENEVGSEDSLGPHNVGAAMVARAMGDEFIETPPVVHRSTPVGDAVVSLFLSNAESAVAARALPPLLYQAPTPAFQELSAQIEHLALFDLVLGMDDRHGGNWLIHTYPFSGTKTVVAIDHDLAFSDPEEYEDGPRFSLAGPASYYAGDKISPSGRKALRQLQKNRAHLRFALDDAGVQPDRIDGFLGRVDHLAKTGRFPHQSDEYAVSTAVKDR